MIARAVGLGAFAGVFSLGYLLLIHEATHLLWGDDWATADWFSGNLWTIAIPVAAGVLVGVIYRVFKLPPRFHGFIDELEEGKVEPSTAPGAIGIAVLSLISGPSVGPEAPLGTAGGAAGTWLARRRGGDEAEVRQMTFVGISGAFGGLMSTPIGGPLLAFELEHDQTHNYYFTHLVPGVIAGAVAFGIMWPVLGAPFEGLIAIEQTEFKSWMLLAAAAIGLAGAVAAVVVGRIMVFSARMMSPLDKRPVVRGAIAGLAVGLLGFTLPLTLFSGQESLPDIVADAGAFGVGLLLVLALFKAAALGISLGGGFYGGPIFPVFFIGSVLGIATNTVFPDVPLSLAVGAMMAAMSAALALLPLSMAVLASVMIGAGFEVFGAIALASISAYALRVFLTRGSLTGGDVQEAVSSSHT